MISRRKFVWLAGSAGALLLLWFLLVSGAPAVAPKAGATPESAGAGRAVLTEVKKSQKSRAAITSLRLDSRAVGGLAVLAGEGAGIERIGAEIRQGKLSATVSLPFLGHWINASSSMSGRHEGFPALDVRIGRLDLPNWATRGFAEAARWAVRRKGAEIPPLDQVVRSVSVSDTEVHAELRLPGDTNVVQALVGFRGRSVDEGRVAGIYCALVKLQRTDRDIGLPGLVQHAFAPGAEATPERNRAAFVALAMVSVRQRADDLAPGAAQARKRCGSVTQAPLLAGRPDLAKHWSLSAGLTSVMGADAAGLAGDWKELSDSLPSGSGFSFVDLAANRSGVHVARMASRPETAAAAASWLASASDERLLPIRLLAAQEGLSDKQFLARYRNIRSDQYQAMVRRIDAELARSGLPGAPR